MSNFRLTQTGTELQADLNKVEGLANIKTIGTGLTLSSSGELSASGGSGGSGLPTITLAASQVISQNPMQIQLTDEQFTAMNGRSVMIDASALHMPILVANFNGQYTDDNDNQYLTFAFIYSDTSESYVGFNKISINVSTKVAEVGFNNIYPARANYADSADISKSDVGLGNVDNTSDLNKPISTATQTALNLKADKATTYTKTATDTLLGGKADIVALDLKADKATTYTKAEVDSAIATAITGAINASY